MHQTRIALAALAIACVSPTTLAGVFVLDFEKIPQGSNAPCTAVLGSPILGYYDADPQCKRDGAQSLGASFSTGALAITTTSAGGFGQFPTAHSGVSAAGAVEEGDTAIRVELDDIVLSAFNFWYDAALGSGPRVDLFSDSANVFSQALPLCNSPPDSSGFCGWTLFEVPLPSAGTKISRIVFSAVPNTVVFDDLSITSPSTTPVPEPSALLLATLALGAAAATTRHKHPR